MRADWGRPIVVILGCAVLVACQPGQAASPAAAPSSLTPVVTTAPTTTPAPEPSPAAATRTTAKPSTTSTKPPADRRTGSELDEPYIVNGLPVVSKKHRVSARYRPASVDPHGLTQEADSALDRMSAAARKAGLRLVVRSGYRSYATQAAIFKRQMATYPSEELARRYNAEPGRSEHQTGLAVDLWDGATWGIAMSRTKVGRWLWAHAHEYGFILRYPPGKESVTGYAYEPWHFRYVGVQHSRKFGAKSTLTLEEYLGIR